MTRHLVTEGAEFEQNLLSLAREFAMDQFTREQILEMHRIPETEASRYLDHPRFAHYLTEAVKQWNSGANTEERVKAKYASMVEEAAPELWQQLHERTNPLPARVELFKAMSKIAGLGERVQGPAVAPGDRVSVTINMGEDYKLVRDTPRITIDASPIDNAMEDL